MNKNRYRVIYSQARGMFIAVAEIVKSRTKTAGQSLASEMNNDAPQFTPNSYKKLNPINFAVVSLLGAVVYTMPLNSIANTQIIADKSAPNSQQATILNSSNGVTQVNIQTPSAGGVSRNTYTQFDVGQEGAILNNSRNNTQTQIGGWVQGNPWLAGGEAKVILNEVNSSNPSQLKGYLEVAGKSAQVVIANPSGLVCDGCGVINADRFTLTTGQAVMNQGYLESFRVREGQVTIEGKGLNGSLTPYTDIYTRALNVNAGLYANNLNVALGQNDINVKDQTTPQINATTSNVSTNPNKPNFALDVGQLGGMYAGKIFLVGTENGLGVRNAGSMNATTNQLTLTANGDLINTGNIIANKDQIAIQAHNVKNSGNISSTQNKIQVDATDIQNSGLIATSDELKLNAQDNINNNDGVINAGRLDFTAQNLSNNKGKIEQTGQQQLNITAQSLDNTQGLIGQATKDNNSTGNQTGTTTPPVTDPEQNSSAQDASTVTVAPTDSSAPKTFAAGNIQIAHDIQNVAGQIVNNADINLKVQDSIKNNGGEIQLPELQFNGQNFENQEGKFTAKVVNITAQNMDNQKGSIIAEESFDLNAAQVNNTRGRLQSSKILNLKTTGLENSEGQIVAGQQLNLDASQINNSKGIIASTDSNALLNFDGLNNTSGEISAQNVQLTGQALNNQQGTIQSKIGDLTLNVSKVDNGVDVTSAGNIIAAQNLKLNGQQLNSTGQIYAGNSVDLAVNTLQQHGQLAALNKLSVQSDTISSNHNSVWAAGLDTEGELSNADATLNIKAQQAQIAGKILSGAELQIQVDQQADLSDSESQAKHIQIDSTQLKTVNARLIADQQLDLNAIQDIDNQKGQYSAAQVNIQTKALNNDEGLIQHTGQGDFKLDIADRIDNNAGQIITNAANTNIKTNILNTVDGAILHAGHQQLGITAQNLQGKKAKIQSNGQLNLQAGTASLDNATTAAQNINLKATSLSHQQGQMIQSDTNAQLNLDVAQKIDNTSGVISAAGQASINATELNNQQGVIQTLADKDLKLVTQQLDNQSGKIVVGRDIALQTGQLNNDTGTVYATGKFDLNASQDVSNQQGLLASQQILTAQAQNLNNQKGQIQSEQSDVSLNIAHSLNNQAGSIQSGNTLNIATAQLNNQAGQLVAGTDSQVNTAQLNNQSGTIYSKKQLDVNVTGSADNSAGILAADQNLNLNAQQLLNTAGQIRSENADLNVKSTQDIQNNAGLISAAKNLNLIAQNVVSQQGKIQSGAISTVQLNNLDNSEGVLYAADQLQLTATGELNNSKGIVAAEKLADIQTGSVINDAGQIHSQQDQLKLSVQHDLSNIAGEISAEKSLILNAEKVNNQHGKIIAGESLNASTQQLDNAAGTIYAKDQLNLAVADLLNNQTGTIAANQQVDIQANNINNNAGKIRSEQNKLGLQVQQTLDNQTGEIFAGTDADIHAAVINNQQGTIYSQSQLDLNASQLNNQKGQIYAVGQSDLKVQGDIQNQQGILAAAQNLNIQSAGLNNTTGTLRSEKGDLSLNAQGQLINTQGDIYAAQNAQLNATGVDNTSGQIASNNALTINSQLQQLSNQNGKIIAKTVDLKTGKLDNQTGLIQGEQSVKIDTQQNALINNNSGSSAGILSQGSLDILNVTQLDNLSGYIASVGSTQIAAQDLNNNAGQINSQTDLSIHQQTASGHIDNVAGKIQAQQNLSLNADTINNAGTGSHIVAGEKLTATANKVINSQTKDATVIAGLDAKNIEINAAELDNQSGVIRATDQANLNLTSQLNNQSGAISSLNTLNIGTQNKTLNINNAGGELLAKSQLNLKANELINQGKMISEGNVDIDLKQSYTHTVNDQIAANGTLKLSTEKDLINQSNLAAAQKIELNAQNIDNQEGATISSNETHIDAADTLHNQGLINGELTHIQANRVWNDGARIYGSHVAIQANTLDNKSNAAGIGAVIASRGDMDLGVETLNNQSGGAVKDNARDNAWIFSAGDLNVGGSLDTDLKAQGSANKIYNGSATIESLGNMYLGSKEIQNVNENLKIDLIEKYRKNITAYGKDGQIWDSSIVRLTDSGDASDAVLWVPEVEGGTPTKKIGEDWTRYIYTKVYSEQEVQTTSPAQIIAGGNLGFDNDAAFLNKDSQVLVGLAITNGLDKIDNQHNTVLHSVDAVAPGGFSNSHTVGWNSKGTEHRNKWGSNVSYQPAPVPTVLPIKLGVVKEYTQSQTVDPTQNVNTQTIQQNIDAANSVNTTQLTLQQIQNQLFNIDSGKMITDKVEALKKPNSPDQLKVDSKQSADVNAQQQNTDVIKNNQIDGVQNDSVAVQKTNDVTVRTVAQDYLTLPSNALYITTKDSQAKYLVETDPAFANYKNWLSSDYMLNALGLDPAIQQKRIGDGYYEQRLVQDQIAQLTGFRFLEGYGSDEEQYKALMNNGLSFAQQYHLRPGVALTEAQITQLTSDIVWIEEKTVKLADGTTTKALVPQVYVKARVGDLKGDGTLISANEIQLNIKGDVLNSGTIAGRQAVVLNADNINLINGRIQANQVGLKTQNDLNIIGGQIQADKTVNLDVGKNFKLASSTQQTKNKVGESEFTYKGIDRIAGIYTKAPLNQLSSDTDNLSTTISVRVGGDATLQGSEISNLNGRTSVQSQGKLTLGTVQTEVSNKGYADKNNHNYAIKSEDIGSRVTGAGDIQFNANQIEGKAVTLNSKQGDIILSAQNGITLENGEKLNSSDIAMSVKNSGLLGGKQEITEIAKSSQSIANQVNASGNIILNSQHGDITATHLKADAGKNIQIHADDGNVKLLSTIDEKSVSSTSNKKNFATFKNQQQGYIDQEVAQTQLKAGNNVDINASKNIELQANDIQAGQSIYVGNTLMKRQADGTLKSADGSTMPENVTLSTLEAHDQQWNETQKGYRGIVKDIVKATAVGLAGVEALAPGLKAPKITVSESESKRTEQTSQTGSSLKADNVYVGSSGQTTLTSSNIDAKNTTLSGSKVTLNAAEEQNITAESKSKETVQGLGVKLNKDSIRLGGFVDEDKSQSSKTTETSHKVGSIKTENLTIQGDNGIDILGQNIKATGETILDHGRGSLNEGGYEEKTVTEDQSHSKTVSAELGVRNAYLDAALAVVAVKDAAEAVKQAKDDYSQAQRDYASGKITKDALDDSKANIAMATANFAAAQIAVGAAAAGAAASTATYGFTIGANGQRVETTSTTTTETSKWLGSNLDLNNVKLKSEGQDVNIQGSRLTATGTTTFDGTKDFNVTAGTEHTKQDSTSKTNSQSASYTYNGGGSVSLGKQTSKSHSESLTHVNSDVELNKVSGAMDKLNIQGGAVSIADRGDLKVNEIYVESLQDTASSTSSSKGGSIGAGFGTTGGLSNVTAGYNQSKGKSDSAWVNNTSKLTIGDATHDADLDAMGVTKVTNIGGVIANASKNEDGTLTDHGKLNYTGALELQDIKDHSSESHRGFNVSTSIGKPIKGQDSNSSKFPSGSTTVGLQSTGNEKEQLTKATMGQGTVANVTDSSNRDINKTQEITRDQVTGMLNGSVTVDHRLLTESGRAEIIQEQKDLPKNAEIIGKMTAAGVTSLGVATAGLAMGDQNLKQAYETVMNPAKTFDFVQKHPEAATVLEQFKNGDYEGLLLTKNSIQLLAQALGKDVDVLTTSITAFLGLKGAYDHETNTVVLDVNHENKSTIIETTGHEIAHGQGIKNETSADLVGKSVDWAFDAGIKSNQDTIDQYKAQLGDGKDTQTQAQNQEILKTDNQKFIDDISDHPDKVDDKTSYKQSIANTLFCWNKECTEKFKKLDAVQETAYRQGQDKAVSKFVNDIKNLPNVPREVYEAIKNDPKGTAIAILKGLAAIPGEVWDTSKIIANVNMVGDTTADFEKLGNAEMTTALNGISALLSSGTITVAKKGGKIAFEAAKDIKRVLQNDPAKLPAVKASASGNISANQITTNGKIIDPPQDVLNKQKQLLNNKDNNKTGILREEISDSYFINSGYTKLESKCGSNCFDGVYMKNGELYIVEVKPLKERGSVKLNSANQSTGLDVQMTNEWIISRTGKLRTSGNANAIKTSKLIDQAIQKGTPINKIVVGVNDSRAVTLNLGNKVVAK